MYIVFLSLPIPVEPVYELLNGPNLKYIYFFNRSMTLLYFTELYYDLLYIILLYSRHITYGLYTSRPYPNHYLYTIKSRQTS